jgi:hypothetical protein
MRPSPSRYGERPDQLRPASKDEPGRRFGGRCAHLRPPEQVQAWHDRAVFHFLTDEADRASYLDSVRACLKPGGHVVVVTFGPEGPERCSGLPVERYDCKRLSEFFGAEFELVRCFQEQHLTPGGSAQEFTYSVLRRLETSTPPKGSA